MHLKLKISQNLVCPYLTSHSPDHFEILHRARRHCRALCKISQWPWTNEKSRDLSVKWILDGNPKLHNSPRYVISIISTQYAIHWNDDNGKISTLLAFYAGISPVTGEFPSHRPVTRSFDVFFDLRLNKRLGKQSRRRCFETSLRLSWRHFNVHSGMSNGFRAWICNYIHSEFFGVIIHKCPNFNGNWVKPPFK